MEDIVSKAVRGNEDQEDVGKKDKKVKDGEESSSGLLNHFLPKVVCGMESEEEEEEEEEKRSGGIITHLISNLISPLSPKAGQVSAQKGEADQNGVSPGKQGDERKKKVDHEGKEKEEPEVESGVVGIIDNIVSHFPITIPDDAVPTTDEASILIHSIVKD